MHFIFVDTSAWYALADGDDAEHKAAKAFIQKLTTPLITTNFVVDETITLLRYRLGHKIAAEVGRKLWKEEAAKLKRASKAAVRSVRRTRAESEPGPEQGRGLALLKFAYHWYFE